jgi:cysteine-rich repeat protein
MRLISRTSLIFLTVLWIVGCGSEDPSLAGNDSATGNPDSTIDATLDTGLSTDVQVSSTDTEDTSSSDAAADGDALPEVADTGEDGDVAGDTDSIAPPDGSNDTDSAVLPDEVSEPDVALGTDSLDDTSGSDTTTDVDSAGPDGAVDPEGTDAVAQPECVTSTDCVAPVQPCTIATCSSTGQCEYNDAPVGADCSDGDACTIGDTCGNGKCVSGPVVDCDDDTYCTTDTCNTATGACEHTNNSLPCSDSNACTTIDACSDGICLSSNFTECDDGNPCTSNTCAPESGCVHLPEAATCSDGNACTEGDDCQTGTCDPGAAEDCDDGNPCTTDSCATSTGCAYVNNQLACNDGDACTTADTCAEGVCQGGAALTCDDGNVCTSDSCKPISGCETEAVAGSCDDGDGCTVGDTCLSGTCAAGASCGADATCVGDGTTAQCTCDAGYDGDGLACAAKCGDGMVVGSESCDDKNKKDGDGCSANCEWEADFVCNGEPSVCEPIEVAIADAVVCTNTAGAVSCWGWGAFGQLGDGTFGQSVSPVAPSGLETGVRRLTSKVTHLCATLDAGETLCWGRNDSGQLGNGLTSNSASPVEPSEFNNDIAIVAPGEHHTCAVDTAGKPWCWGAVLQGVLGNGGDAASLVPVAVSGLLEPVQAMDSARHSTCAIDGNGRVWCWGRNDTGALGNGSQAHSAVPVEVVGQPSQSKAVAQGDDHACLLSTADEVYCWGNNSYGQLGIGSTQNKFVANKVAALANVRAIRANQHATCAITNTGALYCWGNNHAGRLGDGTQENRVLPTLVLGMEANIRSVALGLSQTCAVKHDGSTWCWGLNQGGSLGQGIEGDSYTTPRNAALTGQATMITARSSYTCAATSKDGQANPDTVQCWGGNYHGVVGDGSNSDKAKPVAVLDLPEGVTALAAGLEHMCAIASDKLYCWGNNSNYQLGVSLFANKNRAFAVPGVGNGPLAVAAGYAHTCAVDAAGAVLCWGQNADGQLGDGTKTKRASATPASVLTSSATMLALGDKHSCAADNAGAVWCWGNNDQGQLGDGTTDGRLQPTATVAMTKPVVKIVAGGDHSCAIDSGGDLWCWGDNSSGQIGNGSVVDVTSPTKLTGLITPILDVTVGPNNTCALLAQGEVACWGTGWGNVPLLIPGLTGPYQSIAIGGYHRCVLTQAGIVQCWGNGGSGQLGDGWAFSMTPLQVSILP